ALDARLPPLFRWIVERCLTKDAHERYAVTSDLHRDLKMFRDRFNEQVPAPGESRTPASGFWKRSLIVFALVAAIVAGAILPVVVANRRAIDRGALRFVPFTTDPGYQGFPAWSPDGQTVAYAADVNNTLQIFTRRLSSPVSAQITQAPYDCGYPFWS